jgi:hypothetical protein
MEEVELQTGRSRTGLANRGYENMMKSELKKLEEEVASWPHVTVHAHRYAGREFRFDRAEIGHAHVGGIVDIPFTRAIHDALLEEGHAGKHHWVPDSGWVTFHMRKEKDLERALWLLRLSYLRYALRADQNPRALFEKEREELGLSPRFMELLEVFVRPQTVAVQTARVA